MNNKIDTYFATALSLVFTILLAFPSTEMVYGMAVVILQLAILWAFFRDYSNA